jgi:cyclophilin family peptidyl-prolyl cis-trans isomerase
MFNIIIKQYALMNLQRLKYFPSEVNLLKPLFENDDILLSIELAKSIIYFDFDQKNTNLLPSVFKILDEPNLNFAIQAAVSIKDIDTSYLNKSKSFIRRKILETLSDPKKNDRLKSEVFLTGYKILGDYTDFSNLINWFNADDILKIKFAALNPDTLVAFKKLVECYNSVELKNKIEALTQILNFSKRNYFSGEYTQIIFDAISSRYPPLISIAADGIDSDFINNNSNRLKESVSNQIITYKDNPDFIESMISLINLSEKIDTVFFNQIISKAKSSALYSLRKFLSNKTKENISGVKELDQFDNIWQYGFRYSGAVINTSKGSISLKFNSELAPISVANFCRLAVENFYDGVIFHRVVPGFVIQAGDPTATGWGGPGYDIVSELSDTEFEIGQVGMASAGKDTEGSQFFIMQGSYPHLNSRYSLFAKVLYGMEVVYNIIEGDKILSVQLIK